MVAGAGSTWTKGSTSAVTITVKRSEADETCFSHFTGVQIDGTTLGSGDYEAKSGSTVVTLNDSALEKLSAGSHTVTISFDDGQAETDLTVQEDPDLPNTGDGRHVVFWTAMLAISLMGLCKTVSAGRKRRGIGR